MIQRLWACAAAIVWLTATAQSACAEGPSFTSDGQLTRPENYREWIFLSSGLGMTYGPAAAPAAHPRFDNVFVTPGAYKEFLKTGRWPEKTMFALEVRASVSKGSINKGGQFQAEVVSVEIEVKDTKRFPGGWEYFDFGPSAKTAKALGPKSSCQQCHSTNGAVEQTFVQFYPTLIPVAASKGTLKSGAGK